MFPRIPVGETALLTAFFNDSTGALALTLPPAVQTAVDNDAVVWSFADGLPHPEWLLTKVSGTLTATLQNISASTGWFQVRADFGVPKFNFNVNVAGTPARANVAGSMGILQGMPS